MNLKKFTLMIAVLMYSIKIFAQCSSIPVYCNPTVTNIANFGIGLQNVTLGSTINNSTTAFGTAPNYFDFTNLSFSASAGGTVNFSITNGGSNSTQARIFIDWDLNGTFGTISPEMVWSSGTTTAGSVVTGSFNIPSGQSTGVYRVRVVGDLGGSGANPCLLGYGEIEDYTLVVTSSTMDGQALINTLPVKYVMGNNTIAMRMANLGTSAMTSLKIGYRLNNGTPVVQYLTGLNVAAGSLYTATFSTALNISSNASYSLKIWIDSLNGGATTTANNDTLCRNFDVCPGLAGSYTINPSGSGSTNFANITNAIQALVSCGVSAPVIFNIATGTYNQQIDLPGSIDGISLTNSVTFQSATGVASSVVYTFGASSVANNFTLRLNGASFYKFRNLTLTATGTSFGTAMLVNTNSNTDSFFNIVFNGVTTTSNSTNMSVVFSATSAIFNWNYYFNCEFNNGSHGAFLQSSNSNSIGLSSQNLTFVNCKLTNNYAAGLFLQNLDGLRLIGNQVISNSNFTSFNGIHASWIMILEDIKRPIISRNEIQALNANGNGLNLVFLGVNSSVTAIRKPQVFNNMIAIGTGNTFSTYGLRVANDNGSDFLHNTVNIGNTGSTNSWAAAYFESSSSGTSSILNNIFTGNNGSPAIRINTITNFNPCDFNNLHSTGTNLGFLNAIPLSTMAFWRIGTARDANSVNTNPVYVSASNLRITGANLLTMTVNSLVPNDIDNESRCVLTDIGADFHPLANDVGITNTIHPNGNVAGAGARDIVVVLTNLGSNTVTSAVVSYTDGVTPRTINWTGSLAPCQSTNVTFTGSNQFTFTGAWTLTFSASLPNGVADAVPSNNSITRTGCVGLFGNYTINPSGSGTTNFPSFAAAISAMTGCGIASPIVFTVSSGTYSEQVSIPAINGTSAINTITFDGTNASNTILNFSATTAAAPHVFRFNNSNNIIVRNMTIRTDNTANGWPVNFLGGFNNRVARCNIEINGSGATSTAANLIPVVVNGSATSYTTTSTIANNHSIDSNNITSGYFNTTIYCNNPLNTIWIRNNNFTEGWLSGVYAINPIQLRVLNNSFRTRTSTTGTYDIFLQSVNLTGTSFFEISGNRITNSGIWSIFLSSCNHSGSEFNRIYNNMIGGGYRTSQAYGIQLQSVSRTRIYHNSINVDFATTGTSGAIHISNGLLNEVVNNHLVVSNPNATNIFNLFINPATAASVVDFNNYFTQSQLADIFIGSSVPFNAAFPLGGGLNSVRMNPRFVNATDLHSTAFCAFKGVNVGVPLDFDNQTRLNPPTIGADEPINTNSNDIGISEVISPRFPMVVGTQNVKVVLRNFGTNAVTSATVNYRVNNGTVISQSWTGSLNNCDTTHVTFATQNNFGAGSSFVETYTTNPNGITDTRRSNDSIRFSICPAMFGTYTINPSGSGATNFTSFTQAVGAMVCAGVSGPVRFVVSPATYNEQVSVPAILGSSATNNIVFDGVNRSNRIVSFNTTSISPAVVRFFLANDVTFRNLTIRSTSSAAGWGVHYFNGVRNRVSNCDVQVNNNIASSAFYPIVVNSSTNSATIQSALANENITDSSNLDGGWNGINVAMSNVVNTYTAKDNRITESYQYGYNSNGNYQPRVIGNIITLRTAITTTAGIFIINCNNTPGNNIQINQNRIINPGQYGIFLQSCSKSGTDFSQMYNNMAGNFRHLTSVVAGIFLNSVNRMQVFHNSVDLNTSTLGTVNNAAVFIQNGTANDVRNNHLVVSNPLAQNAFPLWISPATAVSAVNSNNYINNSSAFFLNIANLLITRNGYKANYPDGGGVNSNSFDPVFVSITDLHSTNTCETGEDLTAFVPLDLDYQTRSSTPDIGADEVNNLQTNDIGILKINHPRVPLTNGNNSINVTIRNFGSNTVTSATIGYILNNGTAVTQSWTGSLGTCDTANVVFSTAAVISGAINLIVYTSNPNGQTDPNRGNDTSRLNACASMSGTYTIGTSGNFPTFTAAVNALYCGGVSGPVVFNVQTNNYYEQLTINDLITGISASRSVTFQSASGNPLDVFLVNSGTAAQNFTLNLSNAQFLKFRNITIKSIGINFNTALLLSNASNDSFFNCVFEGLTTTSNTTNLAIIRSPSGISNNIYFGRCTVNNGSHGSFFNSNGNATSSENLTFENCTFNNQFAFGMLNQNLNGLRLIGNSITTNSILSNYFGILNTNIHIATDQNRPLILKNRIWGANSGTGLSNIGFGIGSTMSSNRRPIVANNMIQIGSNANASIGIRDNNSVASMVYMHNSVNMGGTSTTNTSAAASFESSVAGNIVLNNSFSAYAGNPAIRVVNPTFYRSDFNNLFTTGTILAYNNFTSINTIALWRTNAFLDTNSVNANPNYSSNFDLRANQSLINNTGIPLSMVMDDIDGQVRCPNAGCQGSTSNPDIGADEFTPLALDAAINSINSPATICPGALAVQVTLRNVGSTTLTAATINYTINGAAQTPFSWTGSLIQNTTILVTVGTPTFTSSNSLIRAWVSAPNTGMDQNSTNDTAVRIPTFQLRGTFTIGGTNPDFRTFNDVAIALNTRGICGPVTFNIRQGTYGDRMQLNAIGGSSAVNFITFRADPANSQPVELIAGNNQGTLDNHTIFLNGTRFIQFRDMRITNNSPGNLTFGSVIRFAGIQDSVLFIRNIVTGPVTINTGVNYAVFNHGTFAANYISRCVVDSNVINNGSFGIYIFGNNNATVAGYEFRNRIRHNDINGSFFYGIQAQFQRTLDVIGNRINMSPIAQISGAGIWCDFVDSFRIERNSINNFGLYGMFFQRCNSQTFGGTFRATINNNMIGGRHTNLNATGIFFQATTPITQYLNIFHNSVSVRSNATGGAIWFQQTSSGQFDFLDIRNNSFANFGTGNFTGYYYNSPPIPNLVIDNINHFSPNPFNYFLIGTTGYSVNNGGAPTWNQNSLFGDPGYFSNTNNLHAARQQLSNRGVNIASCLIDFDNQARPLSPSSIVDIGADEYNVVQNDIGVTALVNTDNCSYTQNLVVRVANFAPKRTDSLRIGWSINGVVQPIVYTNSSINFNNSANFTIRPNFNFTQFTNYNFAFWTMRPNGFTDSVPDNDTLRTRFNFLGNAQAPTGVPNAQCGTGPTLLQAIGQHPGDSIAWYSTLTGGTPIGIGRSLNGPVINGTRNFFAQGVRFGRNITLTPVSNTTVNATNTIPYGGMLSVTVNRRVSLDSLVMRMWLNIPTNGYQLFFRVGTFNGFQTNAAAWTLLTQGTATSFIQGGFPFTRVSAGGLILEPATTYSFYYTTQVNATYPAGNSVNSLNAGPTVSDANMTIAGGGSIIIGQFGANQILNNWHPQMAMVYKTTCEGGIRVPVQITVKPKPVSSFAKGTPFAGIMNQGILVLPDVAEVNKTNTYNIVAPAGYTNAGHNVTWRIKSLSVRTRSNNVIPTSEYDTVHPTASASGMFRLKPTTIYLDSIIRFRVGVEDFGPSFCDTIIERFVVVAPTPNTNFEFPDTICLGTTTTFKNLTTIHSGIANYKWFFGTPNNDSSDIQDPDFVFPATGVYNVKLTAISEPWKVRKDTIITLTITDVPNVKFKVLNQCEGTAVSFQNQTTVIGNGLVRYEWIFGDNSPNSTQNSPTHLYALPRAYRVTLNANYSGCKISLSKNAYQFARPVANFIAPIPTCAETEVNFVNTSTLSLGNMGSIWAFGDGDIYTFNQAKHAYKTDGTFNVKLIAVSEFDCKDSITKQVQIKVMPKPAFTADQFCSGLPTVFTNTTVETVPSPIYTWNVSTGLSSNAKSITQSWPNAGIYQVKLKTQFTNGCIAEISRNIEVLIQPKANFTVSDICAGQTARFVNLTTGDNQGIQYEWDLGNGTSTDFSPIRLYNNTLTETYTVKLKASYPSGCSDEITKNINITESPICNFTIKNNGFLNYTFTPSNTSYTSYEWFLGQGGYSTVPITSYTYSIPRDYSVTMKAKNAAGCDCEITQKVKVSTGLNDKSVQSGISVYPNPNNGMFTVNNLENSAMKVEVYNLVGSKILSQTSEQGKQEVNMTAEASGVYLVKVTVNGITNNFKITIAN